MNIYLTGFIALLVLAWAGALGVSGLGTDSLPWAIYTQAFYLSGLLAIGLMSLAMVLAIRPTWLERLIGGMDRVYRMHKWTAILAVSFAAMHWLLEDGDDLIKSVFGRHGQPLEEQFSGLLHELRDFFVTDLHYSTRNRERDPIVSRLETLCADLPGVSLHIHDSQAGGSLTAEHLARLHDASRKTEVWFCGPRRFAKQLRRGLNRAWRGRLRFHQEAFEMR